MSNHHEPLEFIGGAKLGFNSFFAINWTRPLARLVIETEVVVLKAGDFNLRFEQSDIEKVTCYSGVASAGVRIIHKRTGYAKFVVFWTDESKTVMERLNEWKTIVE